MTPNAELEKQKQALKGSCLGLIAFFFICCIIGMFIKPDPKKAAANQARWEEVAASLRESGVTVAPYDPELDRIMVITLPSNMAMTATDRQIQELKLSIQNRLGPNRTVIIKSPAGQTLAQ